MKLFLFFAIEIGLFSYFAENFGFLETLFWYWGPTLLTFALMPLLSRRFRSSMNSAGSASALHQGLINLGLLSLALPFLTLRIVGLLLILPGFRHLLIWKLSGFIKTQMTQYQTQQAGGSGNFFYFRTGATPWPQENPPMKDVTPIDVQKIENPSKED